MSAVPLDGDAPWAKGSFLGRIAPADRQELLALGVTRTVSSGRRLFVEGARDTHVEVLRRGFAKVTATVDGSDRLLAIRLPGDLVGEFAAITGQARSATVAACGDVVSTVIRQVDFLRLLDRRSAVAAQVTAVVGERLRSANERRAEFTYPVHVRLARVLAEIAASCGRIADDEIVIGVALSHTELATLVGAATDTTQRALRTLRAERLIRTGYRRITVLDLAGLRALAAHADRR
ncbi:Crp/Fnr family transcriptional regulator [Micromonospora sp. DT48]|uniref:Crp/Fnr family transcriptional regulator n=1 Tax=unclassified Micromonospora TaxID=2617518 RepID=UPI0012BCC1CE|nr:Crp/Fnr family transcriptional regulator [Micromonospora sp. CP22]MTK04226.1 Crp/Fnr family transcriptional regulator [Micromonospora sp. CP22]